MMTLPNAIPKGGKILSLSVVHPGNGPAVIINVVDSLGRVRADWTIHVGRSFYWSDSAGFSFNDDVMITSSGPLRTAIGELRWRSGDA